MLDGIKSAVSSRFNVKRWLGYDHLKDSARFIAGTCTDVVGKDKRVRPKRDHTKMSFEELMQINQLTDEDVRKSMKSFRLSAIAFGLVSIVPFLYSIYLFKLDILLGGLVSFMSGILCLAYTYRYCVLLYRYRYRVLTVTPKQVFKNMFHIK